MVVHWCDALSGVPLAERAHLLGLLSSAVVYIAGEPHHPAHPGSTCCSGGRTARPATSTRRLASLWSNPWDTDPHHAARSGASPLPPHPTRTLEEGTTLATNEEANEQDGGAESPRARRAPRKAPASARGTAAKPAKSVVKKTADPSGAAPQDAPKPATSAASANTGPLPVAAPTLDPETVVAAVPTRTHGLRNMSEIRHYFRTNLRRSSSWEPRRSTCSAWIAGCAASPTSRTTTAGRVRIRGCSARCTSRMSSGRAARRSTTGCCATTRSRAIARLTLAGEKPRIALVFFDEETEAICEELGYELILPAAKLREHLDSKMVTTRIADAVGVPSVRNIITTVSSYQDLQEQAEKARPRIRSGRADRVWGLRQDHVLRHRRVLLREARRRHHRARAQGHEADQQPPDRGRGVLTRHGRSSARS